MTAKEIAITVSIAASSTARTMIALADDLTDVPVKVIANDKEQSSLVMSSEFREKNHRFAALGMHSWLSVTYKITEENNKKVTVHFVLWTAHTSVIWVILLTLVFGLVGGLLLSQLVRRRGRRQSR